MERRSEHRRNDFVMNTDTFRPEAKFVVRVHKANERALNVNISEASRFSPMLMLCKSFDVFFFDVESVAYLKSMNYCVHVGREVIFRRL